MFAQEGVYLPHTRLQPAVLLPTDSDFFGQFERVLQNLFGMVEFVYVGGSHGQAVVYLCDFGCGFVFQLIAQVKQVFYGFQTHPALVVVGGKPGRLKTQLQ